LFKKCCPHQYRGEQRQVNNRGTVPSRGGFIERLFRMQLVLHKWETAWKGVSKKKHTRGCGTHKGKSVIKNDEEGG